MPTLSQAQQAAHAENMRRLYDAGGHAVLRKLQAGRWVDVRPLTRVEAITLPLDPRTEALFHRHPLVRKRGQTPMSLSVRRAIGSRPAPHRERRHE